MGERRDTLTPMVLVEFMNSCAFESCRVTSNHTVDESASLKQIDQIQMTSSSSSSSDGPTTAVKIKVGKGTNFVHPNKNRRVLNSQVVVLCGRHTLVGSVNDGESPTFNTTYVFPYNNEVRFRVITRSGKGRDLGYHDIDLGNKQQVADTYSVSLNLAGDAVDWPRWSCREAGGRGGTSEDAVQEALHNFT